MADGDAKTTGHSWSMKLLRRLRRAPLTTVRNRLRRLAREIADAPHEWRLGVRTGAVLWQYSGGDLQNAPCEPAPYRTLAAIDRHMSARGVPTGRFADLGTGLGRPLYAFASRFTDLRGYEIIPAIQTMAARQLAQVQARHPGFRAISLICADATVAVPLDEPVVLFLYHPFGPPPMARLCARLREARCELHIYYVNPVLSDMIAAAIGPPVDRFLSDFPVNYFHVPCGRPTAAQAAEKLA